MRFNFDEMSRLAKTSPEQFAERRAALVTDAIAKAANPASASQLQSSIDQQRWSTGPGLKVCELLLAEIEDNLDALQRILHSP